MMSRSQENYFVHCTEFRQIHSSQYASGLYGPVMKRFDHSKITAGS